MMNFFKGIKSRRSKEDVEPVYKQYTHGDLKVIAMRTRIIFEELYKKESMKISLADNQFKKVQASHGTIHEQYEVLQQISRKVIETQIIKLYIEILKKIQAYAPQIINTKGDVVFMKQQIKWFQCILWYRKCKNLTNIDEFDKFCWNFFKGVDIIMELNLKCELFKVYEGLQYLDDNLIIPLDLAVQKIIPYVSFEIDQKELDEMKRINGQEIRKRQQYQKRKLMEENPFVKFPQNPPKSNQIPTEIIPKENKNISNIVKEQQKNSQTLTTNPNPYNHYPEPQNKSSKEYSKLPNQDEQFAIDLTSTVHKPNNTPNPNKSFKSNDLNLIDWQAMYRKKQPEDDNPYINNSRIGLIDHDYSMSSEENSYDQTTLPYPPSGVISFDDIAKKDDFYIDTLPIHQSQPVKSQIGFNKKSQNHSKPQGDSFINSIENQFFSNQQNYDQKVPQQKINTFDQEDLLKDVSENKQKNKQAGSGGKSLNKLFGFKFKSNLSQPSSTQPTLNPFGSNSQNYGQNNKEFLPKSNSNQIDDLLDSLTKNTNQNKPKYGKKTSDIDEILQELNNNPVQADTMNPTPNKFSVDEMIRDLNSIQVQNNNKTDWQQNTKENEHLDEDIKSLIQSHRKQLKKEPSKNSSNDEIEQMKKQAEDEQWEISPCYYPDDCERFNDSKIKFSEEMELLDDFQSRIKYGDKKQTLTEIQKNDSNPQLPQQIVQHGQKNVPETGQFDYSSLEKDLFESLKIIKNHYREQIPSGQEARNNLERSQSMQKSAKKPYMVSIYARNQYMQGIKLAKHQSCQ